MLQDWYSCLLMVYLLRTKYPIIIANSEEGFSKGELIYVFKCVSWFHNHNIQVTSKMMMSAAAAILRTSYHTNDTPPKDRQWTEVLFEKMRVVHTKNKKLRKILTKHNKQNKIRYTPNAQTHPPLGKEYHTQLNKNLNAPISWLATSYQNSKAHYHVIRALYGTV